MKPLAPRLAVLGALSVSALLAGAFWEETAPEDWSQAQIEELLGDSPWAQPAEVRFTGDRGVSRLPGGLPGGRGRTGGGTRIPRPSPGPGVGGSIGFPYVAHARESAFEAEATIVWTSALPVRQALERLGAVDTLRDVHSADFYIVTIDGLPRAMAPLADTPDVLRQSARIERKDGGSIHAKRIEVRPRPGAPAVDLYFPRDVRLNPDEKSIEVIVTAADYMIRRKFKPAEMMYRGRLEM